MIATGREENDAAAIAVADTDRATVKTPDT